MMLSGTDLQRNRGLAVKKLHLLFIVTLVVPLLGSDAPPQYAAATEYVGIEGTWRCVSVKHGGVEVQPLRGDEIVLVFRGGSYEENYFGQRDRWGPCAVDAARRPGRLDLEYADGPHKGKVWQNIYRLDGDTLRIAYTGSPDARPVGFEGTPGVWVHTYKRVR
jgi:uncharacterized protein (TIGR03067 family)